MVKKEQFRGEETFLCQEYSFDYREKDKAVSCEKLCRDRGPVTQGLHLTLLKDLKNERDGCSGPGLPV